MFNQKAMRGLLPFSGLMIGLLLTKYTVVSADEAGKKPEAVPPRIAMFIPLAVPVDATTKVIVRGWGLEGAKEVRPSNPQCGLKILSTAKASIPNKQDAKQIGDTQIELEVTIPQGVEPGEVDITIVQPEMTSAPHKLLIGCSQAFGGQALAEKEPNDSFAQAQPLRLPQIVDGQVDGDGNVDVYSFELPAVQQPAGKQQITIEVQAHRYGSNLDSILTLFDQRGNIIAVNDDAQVTQVRDSKISFGLSGGKYFISLQDAHDRGGPAHPYRLMVTVGDTTQ